MSNSTETNSSPDLITAAGVQAYVTDTPFDCTSPPTPLSGGFANFCWRLHLKSPHDGQRTVILKHAEAYAALVKTLPLDLSRFAFEREALDVLSKADFMRGGSPSKIAIENGKVPIAIDEIKTKTRPIVRVPTVYHYDKDNHVLIIEDAGDVVTLKEFISSAKSTVALASQIGQELGTFLAGLHTYGKGNAEMHAKLSENTCARELCAWRTAGRLLGTAERYGIAVGGKEHDDLDQVVKKMTKDTMDGEETLTMGDFWTGNVLVSISSTETLESLYIVDWELVKYGPAAGDVGQFVAESWLLARFRSAECGFSLLEAFQKAYGRGYEGFDAAAEAEAAMYASAHVAVWGPIVPWAEEEPTRLAVVENLEYIGKAWDVLSNGGDGGIPLYISHRDV